MIAITITTITVTIPTFYLKERSQIVTQTDFELPV